MNKSQGVRRAVEGKSHARQRKAGIRSKPLGAAVVPEHDTAHANYTVFFSHKLKDKHVAHSIKRLLTENTANVAYFVSEDIEKGDNWHKAITEQLDNARFLVLVFTDPDEDWSWCLYETGFFDALARADTTQTRRIHCLHHPNTGPPKPIAHLQPIPATKGEVAAWLTYLFDATNQPKTCNRDKVQIPQLANDICGFFEGGGRPLYSAKSVNIEVDGRSLASPDDLPADSIIRGGPGLMTELFGANTGTLDWSTAKKRFESFPNSREVNLNAWKERSRSLHSISKNNRVVPLQSTIFVDQGPKRYRPVISRAKELSPGQISCEILLIEEVGGPMQNVDKDKIEKMIREWEGVYQKIWKGIGFGDVRETYSDVSAEPFSNENITLLADGMRELEEMNRDFLDMAVARAKILISRELEKA